MRSRKELTVPTPMVVEKENASEEVHNEVDPSRQEENKKDGKEVKCHLVHLIDLSFHTPIGF